MYIWRTNINLGAEALRRLGHSAEALAGGDHRPSLRPPLLHLGGQQGRHGQPRRLWRGVVGLRRRGGAAEIPTNKHVLLSTQHLHPTPPPQGFRTQQHCSSGAFWFGVCVAAPPTELCEVRSGAGAGPGAVFQHGDRDGPGGRCHHRDRE